MAAGTLLFKICNDYFINLFSFKIEEIFGCHLEKLCKREGTTVPKFVVKCIETVEKRG